MEKKQKIDSECRKFKDQWNIQYFVIEPSNKALCLICNESIAVLKEYNMKRHYETKHSQNYSKYTGIVRTEKFEALKRGLKSQQSLFTKVKTEQEAATRASFRVALEIAKRGKPFTDGEMIKECIIAVVEEMCPEKVNLLKTVSMSANTVARRVENIAENISSQLFDKNGHVEWFSLALDESTDVSDTAQVLIYIRGVDKSYEVHEELLDMYSIHGTTTGTDIFKGVEMAINKKNLRWKNLKLFSKKNINEVTKKARVVVKLFKRSPLKNEILLNYMRQDNRISTSMCLILDCRTRWNSLLNMLERLLSGKSAIQKALIDMNANVRLTDEDFYIMTQVISALKPFRAAVAAICRRDATLSTAEATVKFLLEKLQAQYHSLSKDLQKSFQKRILEERCNKTSLVLQYLHNPQAQLEKKKMAEDFRVKLLLRLKPLQEQMAEGDPKSCTTLKITNSANICPRAMRRMEKKRKIDSECRKFKDQWNIQYFVIESSNKALCLICNESIAVLKEYNMKRHYETKHSQNYSKYTGIVRTEKFEALKRGLKSQQSLFTKVKTEQEAATRASFRVALEIAKRGKPFTDGEMIKECIIAVVEEMCPEKSTDVSDTAQVLIYIRGVDKSYEVHEELLDMYSIHGTTTGTDIFKGVEMAINKKNLRWKNLKCITTDGGKNMSGKDKGVVALVSKAVENDGGSKPLVLHCIIHQQSLCGKCLDMSDVLKPVISTVNFIRSFGLNHRQFRQFIAEIGETDLPYHTAVRWLSCGKVLQRFFELRAVIEIFLNEKHRPLTELQNNAWLWKLAFYVDLTKHVNELNLRLKGENQHLPDLYTNIKSFRMKLILFQSQLRSKCFSHFKTCEIFSHTTETEFPIDFAIETLSALKINFDTRFSDFDAIANQIKIFQNPFDADIETLAPELQMEMIDLQCSDIIKNKYENSSLLEFYKSLPLTQFDNLHKFARGLFSVFGTTYLCEKTFSKMKYTKNVYRSKLTDEHLKSLLIIGT
ncbi:EPM2AIP1, partial [Cordylochernes scorpioides]